MLTKEMLKGWIEADLEKALGDDLFDEDVQVVKDKYDERIEGIVLEFRNTYGRLIRDVAGDVIDRRVVSNIRNVEVV